jgi:hypothetical protein
MTSGAPHFIEIGHFIDGAHVGTRQHANAREFLSQVVRALEVHDAVLHAEAKCTGAGWQLIEVALRPAGGLIADLARDSLGVDLYEEQLRLALGMHPVPAPVHPAGCAGIRFVTGTGTVADFPSMAPVREGLPDIRFAERLLPPGSTIPEVNANWWRAGYVYGVSSQTDRLRQQLTTAADRLFTLLGLDLADRAGS